MIVPLVKRSRDHETYQKILLDEPGGHETVIELIGHSHSVTFGLLQLHWCDFDPLILQFKTKYGKRVVHATLTVNDTLFNSTNGTQEVMEIAREEVIPVPGQVNGVNALGLVVFSMCFGLIIGNMKEQGQLLRDFFDSLNEAIMRLVAIIMW